MAKNIGNWNVPNKGKAQPLISFKEFCSDCGVKEGVIKFYLRMDNAPKSVNAIRNNYYSQKYYNKKELTKWWSSINEQRTNRQRA